MRLEKKKKGNISSYKKIIDLKLKYINWEIFEYLRCSEIFNLYVVNSSLQSLISDYWKSPLGVAHLSQEGKLLSQHIVLQFNDNSTVSNRMVSTIPQLVEQKSPITNEIKSEIFSDKAFLLGGFLLLLGIGIAGIVLNSRQSDLDRDVLVLGYIMGSLASGAGVGGTAYSIYKICKIRGALNKLSMLIRFQGGRDMEAKRPLLTELSLTPNKN